MSTNDYWNSFASGWLWIVWMGFIILMFSSLGNWRYTYQAHRRYQDLSSDKTPMNLLAERYARGDITSEEFAKMREEISSALLMEAANVKGNKVSSPKFNSAPLTT